MSFLFGCFIGWASTYVYMKFNGALKSLWGRTEGKIEKKINDLNKT